MTPAPPGIPRRADPQAPAPLSFAQQRLWYRLQLDPDNPTYRLVTPLLIDGPLDAGALERSVNEIVRRHEALRAVVMVQGDEPMMRTAPFVPEALERLDLSALDAEARDAALRRLIEAAEHEAFDLTRGPLLRQRLVRLAPASHALITCIHHLACDGQAAVVWTRELMALYAAFSTGQPSPLPDLPVQYGDFALWQRELLDGPHLASQLAWWREQLRGAQPTVDLPTDRPRGALPAYRGESVPIVLDERLVRALRTLCRREGVTLFMTALAAFAVLLRRHAWQDDLVVSTTIAGRNRSELEGMMGLFVNALALRIDLRGDPSFRALLKRVQAVTLDAYDHQDLPFEKLIEQMPVERNAVHQPLSSVMLQVLARSASGRRAATGSALRFSPLPTSGARAGFDLAISLSDIGAPRVDGELVYNADLFERETAERIVRQLQSLLRVATENPEQPISAASMVETGEARRLLVDWDRTGAAAADLAPVHRLVGRWAADAPAAVALAHGDKGERRLTYGALAAMSRRIADALRQCGAQRGDAIAVIAEDPALRIAAMLGALRASAAFCTLDPSQPTPYVIAVVEELSPAMLLIGQASLRARPALADLLRHVPAPVLVMDAGADEARQLLGARAIGLDLPSCVRAAGAAPADAAPADAALAGAASVNATSADAASAPTGTDRRTLDLSTPAYVAFTSGSTGRPKAILHTHQSFSAFLGWFRRAFGVAPGLRVAQWTPPTFDPSLAEIFGALTGGATLCVPPDEARRDPAAAIAWLRRARVSLLQAIPSFVTYIAAAVRAKGTFDDLLPDLRLLLLAGEPVPTGLARELLHLGANGLRIVNLYGPTEAIVATCHELGPDDLARTAVPAGRAIDGGHTLVLDDALELCPVGVPGEVYLRGCSLAQGYLRRPVQTASVFRPWPLASAPGGVIYRTGDIGRWLPDGTLMLMGRRDLQVKVRGMRVEMEAVEAAVAAHPAVREAAVAAVAAGGETALAAFVVLREPIADKALRAFLKERLPAHMVPSPIVRVDALPRTASGKIDRGALPDTDPLALAPAPAAPWIAPQTETERRLAALWDRLLRVPEIGVQDDFFERGGHSLLAVRLLNAVRQEFGRSVPLKLFLDTPTIAGLAQALDAAIAEPLAEPVIEPVAAAAAADAPVSAR